jgi:hypothetical protein
MKYLVFLLLVGCGQDVTDCSLKAIRVHGDFAFNCDKFETNFELAKSMLVEYEIIPQDRIDIFFTGEIELLNKEDFKATNPITKLFIGNEDLWGLFEFPEKITLNKTGRALLHELCHYYDYMVFQNIGDQNHTGWTETTGQNKNRDMADILYSNRIIPIE